MFFFELNDQRRSMYQQHICNAQIAAQGLECFTQDQKITGSNASPSSYYYNNLHLKRSGE